MTRINRFLAQAGCGSRRAVEQLILDGRVEVNGQTVESLATQVGPEDFVKVDGKRVSPEAPVYLVLNKPPGYVSTASDELNRRTIFSLLPGVDTRLFHVGRLDKESEGLLILTNDGDFTFRITHAKYKIDKEYEVILDSSFDASKLQELTNGIYIPGGKAKAESAVLLAPNKLRLVLHQGIKRQIRLMLYALKYEVIKLKRIRVGTLTLRDLPAGAYRHLTMAEVQALKAGKNPPEKSKTAPSSRKPIEKRAPRPGSSDRPRSSDRSNRPGRSDRPDRPRSSDRSDRPGRSDRSDRPRYSDRSDRPSRSDRPGRPRSSDRSDRPSRSDRSDRPRYSDRSDRPGRSDRPRYSDRSDRPGRSDRPDRPRYSERSDRPGRSDRPDRPRYSDRSDRPGRSDRPRSSDRSDRPGRFDRSDRPRYSERSDRPGRSDRSDRPDRTSSRSSRSNPSRKRPR